jgi:hypothetical protein
MQVQADAVRAVSKTSADRRRHSALRRAVPTTSLTSTRLLSLKQIRIEIRVAHGTVSSLVLLNNHPGVDDVVEQSERD